MHNFRCGLPQGVGGHDENAAATSLSVCSKCVSLHFFYWLLHIREKFPFTRTCRRHGVGGHWSWTGRIQSLPQGQTFPPTKVTCTRWKVRDTIIVPFFSHKDKETTLKGRALKGHLNLPRYPLTFPIQSGANGLGGGPSGCTHYSPVSTAGAEVGL